MGRAGRIYRKVRASFVDQPTFFGWIEDGRLSASGIPSSENQIAWLAKHGVGTIITLTEYPLQKEWLDKNGVKGVHIPIGDHSPPTAEGLMDAIEIIKKELRTGRAVHVHCLAGKGRTGTLVAAFLAETKGLAMKDAIAHVRKLRPGSVEWSQEQLLYEFEKLLEHSKKS